MDPGDNIGERIELELSCPFGEPGLLSALILDLVEASGNGSISGLDVEARLKEVVAEVEPDPSSPGKPLHASFEFIATGLRVTVRRAGIAATRDVVVRRG